MKIHFHLDPCRDGWTVFAYEQGPDGERTALKIDVTRGTKAAPGMYIEQSGFIDRQQMHAFAEAMKAGLAEAGFLADSGPAHAELKATKAHLEDMRAIVFKGPMP